MSGDDEEKVVRNYRPSLKAPPRWKSKLRENCFRRVREDRSRLLWKLRLPDPKDPSSKNEDLINSTLQNIVSDELRKIKEISLDGTSAPKGCNATDDMIWEYAGLQTAYEGYCEEILLEMQRIFYEDLGSGESRTEPENFITTWEDEEDEYLARLVYDHMQLNSDQVTQEVWCLICKQGKLHENIHHIYCSQCKFKLKRGHEVDLSSLRLRLGEAHAEHLDIGCRQRPEFCIETKFELTALYIKCQGCDTFDIVL
ncbi:RPA-interacting protein A [Perilla frutescens var. frutescens]|nr:RPA-interacting protein A [Perilla frutescens var. frutescens]